MKALLSAAKAPGSTPDHLAKGYPMGNDGTFVIWIVLAAVPVGLLLISLWSRARTPGEDRVEVLERETKSPEEP